MYGAGMYLESCNCNPILYLPSSPSESHSQGQKVGRLSEWERETENQYDIEFYPRLVTLLTDTPCYCYFKTCFTVISLSGQGPVGATTRTVRGSVAWPLVMSPPDIFNKFLFRQENSTCSRAAIIHVKRWSELHWPRGGEFGFCVTHDIWSRHWPSSDWVMSPWHKENISPFLKALIRMKPNIYVEIFRREKL